jgi:hypothetical protein
MHVASVHDGRVSLVDNYRYESFIATNHCVEQALSLCLSGSFVGVLTHLFANGALDALIPKPHDPPKPHDRGALDRHARRFAGLS